MERSFSEEKVGNAARSFYMVRCADKTTAEKVKSTTPPALIFFDGDGKEYWRTNVSPGQMETTMQEALKKYASRPISWSAGSVDDASRDAGSQKKLMALAFLDDKKESEQIVNALQDRWLAKHHDRLVFVRMPYERDSAECKKWGVTSAATLVLVNPKEEDPKKAVIDRLSSKKEVTSIRAFLLKAFNKFKG